MNFDRKSFSYDELHYIGQTYLQTHPDQLAALGRLHGLRPAPVERCRYLELACGDGANLVAMAYGLPGSTFEGIDLAAGPLEVGRAQAAALGLSNVRLEARDLLAFPADAGEYDYIVAHGFYSWCPPEVRDKILAVCAAHLAPQGIAFVSFNAYPGYHLKELERNLMLYHLSRAGARAPQEQAREAMGILDLMARCQPQENLYQALLNDARQVFEHHFMTRGEVGLAWFHHDLLSPYNSPVYYRDFADHAARHGLQFVTDSALRVPRVLGLAPDADRLLRSLEGDITAREQYMDFLMNVPFRQVLLCREGLALDRTYRPAAMEDLFVAGNFTPEAPGANPAAEAQGAESFVNRHGKLAVKHPDARGVLRRLGEAWPCGLGFRELAAGQSSSGTPEELAEFVLRLCVNKYASFRSRAAASALTLGERPEASAVARMQAERGAQVTNLYHEGIALTPSGRQLLRLLDGTRDRARMLAELRVWVESGQAAEAHRHAQEDPATPAESKEEAPLTLEMLESGLDGTVRGFVGLGLIVR